MSLRVGALHRSAHPIEVRVTEYSQFTVTVDAGVIELVNVVPDVLNVGAGERIRVRGKVRTPYCSSTSSTSARAAAPTRSPAHHLRA